MQKPFITDQVYRLHFMAAEVKTVAFLCPNLPAETAEASVVPSHHQACQHKITSLSGFHSLCNRTELRKTHVSQLRVVLPGNLSMFGMSCTETHAFCSKNTGDFMETTGEAAGNYIEAVTIKGTSHSAPQSSVSCGFIVCLLFHNSINERQN